ncbi:hypothetical protein [Yimella sp. cx-51]|uniref:hypothetical protein n=1 Tax=Yimella sp. cx-51 TaxID=2770551 RepID=UPI00165D8DBB|nr:hypothetical protein [Yimella sp. cx-51]MBC9957316.1 hypothetical protein [Yimella sp. cx-51]QTH39723.1 hypothetical protein J5M86_07570 [Yimella sp. cx-51]
MRVTDTSDLCWKSAVIYCLDIETFYDANGDACGDLAGLAQRIDLGGHREPRDASRERLRRSPNSRTPEYLCGHPVSPISIANPPAERMTAGD